MIRFSYLLAVALAVGVGLYMLNGNLVVGGQPNDHPAPIAERAVADQTELFAVQVETHEALMRTASLEIRGRTEADANISVRAETGGVIEDRPVVKGQAVAAGDLLCTIERGARQARLAQAQAELVQAETDLEAKGGLAGKGYVAKNQIPALQAAVDAARAAVKSAEWELERTEVRAPIAGVVQDPLAEIGDMLQPGETCATLIDSDPMKFIGQVAEREIGQIKVGMDADIALIDGGAAAGKVSYIAPSADPQTRTFRVEIATPNPDGGIKDGVTALAHVPLKPTAAQLVSSAYLTLDDSGRVGVRTVADDGTVAFAPVAIVGGGTNGLWVSGLPDKVAIITVGQDFVRSGQKVKAVAAAGAPMQPNRTAELDR